MEADPSRLLKFMSHDSICPIIPQYTLLRSLEDAPYQYVHKIAKKVVWDFSLVSKLSFHIRSMWQFFCDFSFWHSCSSFLHEHHRMGSYWMCQKSEVLGLYGPHPRESLCKRLYCLYIVRACLELYKSEFICHNLS